MNNEARINELLDEIKILKANEGICQCGVTMRSHNELNCAHSICENNPPCIIRTIQVEALRWLLRDDVIASEYNAFDRIALLVNQIEQGTLTIPTNK